MALRPPYDPRAVAVARAVSSAVPSTMVMLFGSRARGDQRANSDIDLLLLSAAPLDNESYLQASRAANPIIEQLYDPPIGVDILLMDLDYFHRHRVSPNHVAGQAFRDGVTMFGDPPPYPPLEPNDWPDVRSRFAAAARNLRDLEGSVRIGMSQEIIGFLAQQVVENALKGWISALGGRYRNAHDIEQLAIIVSHHSKGKEVDSGMELAWLTKYAVKYRYEGANVKMKDPAALVKEVKALFHDIRDRAVTLTGRTDIPT